MESSAYMALTEQIAEIASHIRKSEDKKAGPPDRQVDSAEAARILGTSRRTLQRMRDGHRIRYTTLGGKCMYPLSEIDRFITEHTVTEENGTPGGHQPEPCAPHGKQRKDKRTEAIGHGTVYQTEFRELDAENPRTV